MDQNINVESLVKTGITSKIICQRETEVEEITVEEDRTHGNGSQPPK